MSVVHYVSLLNSLVVTLSLGGKGGQWLFHGQSNVYDQKPTSFRFVTGNEGNFFVLTVIAIIEGKRKHKGLANHVKIEHEICQLALVGPCVLRALVKHQRTKHV